MLHNCKSITDTQLFLINKSEFFTSHIRFFKITCNIFIYIFKVAILKNINFDKMYLNFYILIINSKVMQINSHLFKEICPYVVFLT